MGQDLYIVITSRCYAQLHAVNAGQLLYDNHGHYENGSTEAAYWCISCSTRSNTSKR